ncbi:unnamed protein product [Cyprideis torosa]|uniref:Uncharacterized protein n=1 Tax=Cyprideis torosa TaxID=163714 RepID=A0A7R8WLU0_9CRUS|nr:unnamed protein product [Cyprideis torosa]CAG0898487.1 unnamed protein product [Cyprideis torosa]
MVSGRKLNNGSVLLLVVFSLTASAAPTDVIKEDLPTESLASAREGRQFYGGYISDPTNYAGPFSPLAFVSNTWETLRGYFGTSKLRSLKAPFVVIVVLVVITGLSLLLQVALIGGGLFAQLLPDGKVVCPHWGSSGSGDHWTKN